ncbi:MAG: hypothetical protein PWQ49_748 [Methanohalophilus sp.]|nr:hypothetical protein [Methanohalophilus sp.]
MRNQTFLYKKLPDESGMTTKMIYTSFSIKELQ